MVLYKQSTVEGSINTADGFEDEILLILDEDE